jgi:hypothetical protein
VFSLFVIRLITGLIALISMVFCCATFSKGSSSGFGEAFGVSLDDDDNDECKEFVP